MYVFNRFYVGADRKGFCPGDSAPEGYFTNSQAISLLNQGFIKEVFTKASVLEAKPIVVPVVEEDEVEEVFDPIEALDPEKKRGRKK